MRPTSTLDGVELFVAVVAAGSLSEAGRRLGLTSSSVGRRMDELEAELGTRLLTRTTRRLALTEAGAVFHERAARIAADLSEARAAVAGLDEEPKGMLRVDAPTAFGVRHIAPLLSDLLLQCPQLSIDLTLHDRHIDPVEEGVDLVVRLGVLPDSGLIATKLAPLRRVVVASPAYLQRHGAPDSPDDLQRHECLLIENCAGASRSWHFVHGNRTLRAFDINGRIRTNNSEALVAAALSGAGLAHVPTWLVHEQVADGQLIPLLQSFEAAGEEQGAINALRPASRSSSAKVRVFIDFLRQRFSRPAFWDVACEPGERKRSRTKLRVVA